MNLFKDLEQWAESAPDRPALIEKATSISYGDLRDQALALAGALANKGLTKDDRVLLMVPMSIACYRALFACWHQGIVASFVDPRCDTNALQALINHLRPKAIIAGFKARVLCFFKRPLRGLIGLSPSATGAPPAAVVVDDEHPAIISPTSGSTGIPKLAVRSHGFLRHQGKILGPHLNLLEGQVRMTSLAVFALVDLAHGCTCVIPDGDPAQPMNLVPERLATQIRRHEVQALVGPPIVAQHLTKMVPEDLSSLTQVHTGGAPVRPSLVQALNEHLPQVRVTALYGSTEAEPIASLSMNAKAMETRVAAGEGLPAGKPVAEITLVLCDADRVLPSMSPTEFAATIVSGGDVGEILVSGDHVLPGYLDGRGNEDHKVHVGDKVWHRTGDLGRFDEQGLLWLMGRASASMVHENKQLFPFAIEMAAESQTGCTCALGHIQHTPCLVVDGHVDDALLNWAKSQGISRVVSMVIPLDGRHQGKVAYAELNKRLKEANHGQ